VGLRVANPAPTSYRRSAYTNSLTNPSHPHYSNPLPPPEFSALHSPIPPGLSSGTGHCRTDETGIPQSSKLFFCRYGRRVLDALAVETSAWQLRARTEARNGNDGISPHLTSAVNVGS